MRIHVYRERDGVRQVLVLPGRAAHKAPVLLRGESKEAVIAALVQTLDVLFPPQALEGLAGDTG